jgi:hypothetical protein
VLDQDEFSDEMLWLAAVLLLDDDESEHDS